jgi:tetratricopeptide (TPR) repeat protein
MSAETHLNNKINSVIELFSSGHVTEALETVKNLTSQHPNESLLHNISGVCFRATGQLEMAVKCFKKALVIKNDFADAHYNLGLTFQELNQLDNAIKSYKETLIIQANYAKAHNNLGIIYKELGQIDDSVESFEQVLNIEPDNAEAHHNLGNALNELGLFSDAIKFYEQALIIQDFPETHNNLGAAYRSLGQMDAAIECYKNSISIFPESGALNNLGIVYQETGKISSAIQSFEKAIFINPDNAEAYRNLSNLKKYDSENDPYILKMKSILSNPELKDSERINLCHALAKAYNNLENSNEYFRFLNEGNNLLKKKLNYSSDHSSKITLNIKKMFKLLPESINVSESTYPSDIRPIIIVGMPRSGTTLVEQIISNHHKVYGGGELNTLTKLINPIIKNFIEGDITHLSKKALIFIRQEYLAMLSQFNSSEKIITDKLPLNFRYIGFILLAFPEAKIIHLKRDARATCWSNYTCSFIEEANGYSNNFDDLVHFYNLYRDLMDFWHEQYPNQIYDLCYEDLTNNQEEETKKLLDYCELDWDENCLTFHKNKRAVKTASLLQVREKMYQGSSEVWKKYEAHIQPLIEGLKNY